MKYFKRLMITLCTAFYFCLSSCNYLNVDEYFADTLGYDSIFQNKMNLQKYLWATAAFFPDEGAIWGGAYTPGVTGSDEAFVADIEHGRISRSNICFGAHDSR